MNDELVCSDFCIQLRPLLALCAMQHALCALLYAIIHQASPAAIIARALTTLAATLEPPLRPTLDIQG